MIVMYDDVTLDLIPPNPQAVAAYPDGRFANLAEARQRFPHAIILPIAVSTATDASALKVKEVGIDDEAGDATNATAVPWTRRQLDAGRIPVDYTSAGNVAALISDLASAGVAREHFLIWSAHFTNHPHICSPSSCGFPQADATQWTDKALGRSLDESLCADHFFPRLTVHPPNPPVDSGPAAARVVCHLDRHTHIWEVEGVKPSHPVEFGGPDERETATIAVSRKSGHWSIRTTGRE